MTSKTNTYISLGLVNVDSKKLAEMFSSQTKATQELIQKTMEIAHESKLDPTVIGLAKDTVVTDIDLVAQVLQIQKKSLYARLRRSAIFEKTEINSNIIWLLQYEKTISNKEDKVNPHIRRKNTLSVKTIIEDKHRKRPPLKEGPDVNVMIKLPLGDLSALCVPANTVIYNRRFVINIGQEKEKAIVIASGGNGIIDVDDIKTLYALISHTIQYQTAYHSSFSRGGEAATNLTPIYADTILEMIGRRPGELSNRRHIWRQIVKLRTTEYDVHSLTPFIDDQDRQLFKNNQFRFIESTPSLSEQAMELNDESMVSPAVYEIAWHPIVFKAIFNNKFLFAFPESVFKEPTQIFSLYLDLRKRMQRLNPNGISISKNDLASILLDDSDEYVFQRGFMNALVRTQGAELKDTLKEARKNAKRQAPVIVERDLFGFKVQLIVTGKRTFSKINVTFSINDVLRHSGVKPNEKGGKSAPTLPNLLFSTGQALLRSSNNKKHKEKEVTGKALWDRANKIFEAVNAEIIRTPYALKIKIASLGKDLIIVDFTGDNVIHDYVYDMEKRYAVDALYVSKYLISARERLRPLTYLRKKIDKNEILLLKVELLKLGTDLTIEEVIYHLATNDLIRKLVSETGVVEDTVNIISYMFSD
ncbi:replication initiator protein RctB domain-containing protein [Oceanisphaera pacifica]|uniref:DUF3346 domain-containing protein n=1 Tax=Oceanisphaera pacifica TaxID=2818389 RepID=A0ABS3NIM9_9GAMM|nr:replication initiator protein RctB domain-containing protein [Oceanisphaera pacifica]MBO1520433.1 DUF3346 domain-containing protein [Oceanisphaera pacifica]